MKRPCNDYYLIIVIKLLMTEAKCEEDVMGMSWDNNKEDNNKEDNNKEV
ncbi:MAG TPA: hypothetical protein VFY68_09780 [Nitrososphaeraceae archaeon]|nr:hypothetical protein [Nitrososphaeraceae archaeon]